MVCDYRLRILPSSLVEVSFPFRLGMHLFLHDPFDSRSLRSMSPCRFHHGLIWMREYLGLLECVDHFVQSLDIRNKRFNIIFHYGNEALQISWFCYRWIALGVPRDITNKWKLFSLFFLNFAVWIWHLY